MQVTKGGKKKKGSQARELRLANLLLMSYSCREAWQILTHQLAAFLPYEERTRKEGWKQYRSHMPAAGSYLMLMYRLLSAHNALLQSQVPASQQLPGFNIFKLLFK